MKTIKISNCYECPCISDEEPRFNTRYCGIDVDVDVKSFKTPDTCPLKKEPIKLELAE